jgi:hypothetical protein
MVHLIAPASGIAVDAAMLTTPVDIHANAGRQNPLGGYKMHGHTFFLCDHYRTSVRFCQRLFISSTKAISLAVISTQAGRKPQRMALRTDLILHQAAQ